MSDGRSDLFSSTAAKSRPRPARRSGRSPTAAASRSRISAITPAPGYRPDGNCRACMVEVEGERVLAASLHPQARQPGMKVKTASERAKSARKMVFELLVGRPAGARGGARPRLAASGTGPTSWRSADSRFPAPRPGPGRTSAIPAMAVQLDACIQCNLCVRACREVQVNDVIGMALPRAMPRRSSSTSTIPWAAAPASPAASASRPARPAR